MLPANTRVLTGELGIRPVFELCWSMGCQGGHRQGYLLHVSRALCHLALQINSNASKRSSSVHLLCTCCCDDCRAPNTPVTQGADAPLIDIEVLSSDSGAPVVEMHGYAAEVMRVVRVQSWTYNGRIPECLCLCVAARQSTLCYCVLLIRIVHHACRCRPCSLASRR